MNAQPPSPELRRAIADFAMVLREHGPGEEARQFILEHKDVDPDFESLACTLVLLKRAAMIDPRTA